MLKNGKTLYSQLTEDDVSKYVILCGDPWRVDKVAKLLDNAQHIAFKREFNTWTGYYKGVRVTIGSTGIGAPSAIVALEEMYECGAKVVIRMGTGSGISDDYYGKYLIETKGICTDGTSILYADRNYPATADYELVQCLNDAVAANGFEYVNGITMKSDGQFVYGTKTKFALERRQRRPNPPSEFERTNRLKAAGAQFGDMESAAMLLVGNLMNIKMGSIVFGTVTENLRQVLFQDDPEMFERKENGLFRNALDAIVLYDQRHGTDD